MLCIRPFLFISKKRRRVCAGKQPELWLSPCCVPKLNSAWLSIMAVCNPPNTNRDIGVGKESHIVHGFSSMFEELGPMNRNYITRGKFVFHAITAFWWLRLLTRRTTFQEGSSSMKSFWITSCDAEETDAIVSLLWTESCTMCFCYSEWLILRRNFIVPVNSSRTTTLY